MRRKLHYDARRDYYAVLGVNPTASAEEIRRAYRQRAREVHPDRHPDRREWATRQFQLVTEAYGVLRQAGLRREYDRLRWPHAPHTAGPVRVEPARSSARHAPEGGRTWWERAMAQSARQTASLQTAAPASGAPGWLRRLKLARLEDAWPTLVGVWRTPYAGLLATLAVLLALNLGLVVYMALAPAESERLLDAVEDWLLEPGATEEAEPPPAPTATPDRLQHVCVEPGVQILSPARFDAVGETFSVYGTVQIPYLGHYQIELGYMGRAYNPQTAPAAWELVRPPPTLGAPERPVKDELLAENISLRGRAAGYYAVRLRVTLRDGTVLAPCDIVVQH